MRALTKATRLALALVALLSLSASPAAAQDTTAWVREVFKSTRLNEERTVYVATPDGYRMGTKPYPVLVLLDANDRAQFALAVASVRFLASRNAIPALIVVGIANGKDRTHEMTPAASGATAKQFPTAGGAQQLDDFIVDEVLPAIRKKYRTLPSTILAGHSFGGLYALHVAASRPNVFAGIVAMSPSIWWNDSTAVAGYADSIARAPATPRLFTTSGGLEPAIDGPTRRFEGRLDSIKPQSLAFAYRRYPDDTHGLTPSPSLADGLRFVFEPIALTKMPVSLLRPGFDSAAIVNAVNQTEELYARGAESLGLPELLPESVMNQMGYTALLGLKLPNVALSLFRRNAALYPESANVYDALGTALLASGDTAAAKAELHKAADIATRTHDPVLADARRKLDSLERRVTQAGKGKGQ